MSEDKEKNRLKHEKANKDALSDAQDELGHSDAAEGTRNESKGLGAEIRHSEGEELGEDRS